MISISSGRIFPYALWYHVREMEVKYLVKQPGPFAYEKAD